MASFEFIDNTNSVTVKINAVEDTFGKNEVRLQAVDTLLHIIHKGTNQDLYKVDVSKDTITGTGSGSLTGAELRDAIVGFFF